MKENSEQSAFPYVLDWSSHEGGLTKREYFAAMAMQGLLAHERYGSYTPEDTAKYAVEQADELLKQLAQ